MPDEENRDSLSEAEMSDPAKEELEEVIGLLSREAQDETITLTVSVSDRSGGMKMYGFAFQSVPVAMSNHKGNFSVVPGEKGLLKWVMIGDPGSTMKVTVKRGDDVIAERNESKIEPPLGKAFDALLIRDIKP